MVSHNSETCSLIIISLKKKIDKSTSTFSFPSQGTRSPREGRTTRQKNPRESKSSWKRANLFLSAVVNFNPFPCLFLTDVLVRRFSFYISFFWVELRRVVVSWFMWLFMQFAIMSVCPNDGVIDNLSRKSVFGFVFL